MRRSDERPAKLGRALPDLYARTEGKPRFHWSWGGGAVVVGVVGAGLVWLYRSGALWRLPEWVRSLGALGIAVSYGMVVLQSFVPFAPFALLAGGNALVHGFWIGYLTTWAGAFTGAVLLYALSRSTLHGPLARRLRQFLCRHPRIDRYRAQIERERGWSLFVSILVLRLQPWLPSSVIDVSAGGAGVSFLPFALASLAGQAPMIALESYVGHRLITPREHTRELVVLAAGGLILLLGWLFWRRRRRAKAVDIGGNRP